MADCGLEAVLAELALEPLALTDIQRDVVKQWKSYGADLLVYCEELLEYGNRTEEPKKPKISLDTALNDGRSKQTALTGDNLHQYLLQYIVEKQNPMLVDWPRDVTTLHVLQNHLKCGFVYLQQHNSSSLCAAIEYGYWLNVAYDLHGREKISGRTKETWKKWLECNVGIKDSYARKLRTVAAMLHEFPRFKELSLSFAEVYARRKTICDMLQIDQAVAVYWRSPANTVA